MNNIWQKQISEISLDAVFQSKQRKEIQVHFVLFVVKMVVSLAVSILCLLFMVINYFSKLTRSYDIHDQNNNTHNDIIHKAYNNIIMLIMFQIRYS